MRSAPVTADRFGPSGKSLASSGPVGITTEEAVAVGEAGDGHWAPTTGGPTCRLGVAAGSEPVAAGARGTGSRTRGGRLPLAMRIVAARAAGTPPSRWPCGSRELREVFAQLDWLDTRALHVNLRAQLSWSLRALSPQAAGLFGLLGIAPGPESAWRPPPAWLDTERTNLGSRGDGGRGHRPGRRCGGLRVASGGAFLSWRHQPSPVWAAVIVHRNPPATVP
jgi:hypothetical protein